MTTPQTFVYVLTEGDRLEGCNVVSVHPTFEAALEAARIRKATKSTPKTDAKTDGASCPTYDYFEIEEVPFNS